MRHINWTLLRARLKEALLALPLFFRNPVQGMRNLPDWDWPTILVLQGAFSAACAVLANLLQRDILGMITGLLIVPITNYMIVGIGTGFFYYVFMFFFQREVPFRQIYLHLVFAALPLQIVSVIAALIPPVFLIGAAATLMLLYVGFVGRFHLDPRKTRNLLAGLMLLYVVFWIAQTIRTTSRHEHMRQKATPESLDILEKELSL